MAIKLSEQDSLVRVFGVKDDDDIVITTKKGIIIRGRAGGERCKPQGRSKSQKLKKLFQEYGVPPWERNRIPLLYIGDDLAAVSDLWVCEDFLAEKDEEGIILNWTDNLRN
jgi:tRNA(Ile)-lysidine synthase